MKVLSQLLRKQVEFMGKKIKIDKYVKLAKKYPIIPIVICACLILILVKSCSGPKEFISVSYEDEQKVQAESVVKQKEADEIMTDKHSGIVSFEMYIPRDDSGGVQRELSRDEVVQSIADSVSSIEDDLEAKNTVINEINKINFKLTGSELAFIMNAADITDSFYYINVIRSVAPDLKYPLSDDEMAEVVAPISDNYYRHKFLNELIREQMKH
jgi:hypothetical protein